jgi:glycosyltransferase involved in cell wall biosynthesis
MIAYYFPPLGGIASVRVTEFAKHLPDFGWDPTVLAPRLGSSDTDPELDFSEQRVIRARSIELSRLGKRALKVGHTATSARPGTSRWRGGLRAAAHRFVYRPDPQIGWYPGAVHAGRKALRDGVYDAIFSTSVPMTAHMIGRRLHRSSGLPWVAEFRDPWPDSGSLRRLERSVAGEASELVMTSPTWAREHGRRWGRRVSAILAGTVPVPSADPPPHPVITHLGSFYPEMQDLSTAWTALRRLIDRGELPSVRIRFIGVLPAALREELDRHGLLDRTEVTGYVSHDAALRLLAGSSALIGAGPSDGRDALRGWIPAKLLEYLSTDLPILYLSHTPNDGAGLLGEFPGCHVVEPGDSDGFAAALMTSAGERVAREVENLSWRSRAGQLAGILDACKPSS